MIYQGGCHGGAVQFEVEAPEHVEVEDQLTTYRFNECVAKHLFCRVCGMKSFYIPRSNPDAAALAHKSL